ncbi:hypothetical protein [Bacillus velezensis]|uniref:hypothetical protein n=1 Tax=Bacillus velezensis TaxID=492670 RepID=UPI00143DCF65|nr:hypothetical protein [Bacillus velezensis]
MTRKTDTNKQRHVVSSVSADDDTGSFMQFSCHYSRSPLLVIESASAFKTALAGTFLMGPSSAAGAMCPVMAPSSAAGAVCPVMAPSSAAGAVCPVMAPSSAAGTARTFFGNRFLV